jgi:hypothetical protein
VIDIITVCTPSQGPYYANHTIHYNDRHYGRIQAFVHAFACIRECIDSIRHTDTLYCTTLTTTLCTVLVLCSLYGTTGEHLLREMVLDVGAGRRSDTFCQVSTRSKMATLRYRVHTSEIATVGYN